jgi:hypothetical protein
MKGGRVGGVEAEGAESDGEIRGGYRVYKVEIQTFMLVFWTPLL